MQRAGPPHLLQLFLQCTIHIRNPSELSRIPESVWLFGVAGVLLAVVGPRIGALVFASASMSAFIHDVIFDPLLRDYQVAEEYVPLALLPALGVVLALDRAREHPDGSREEGEAVDDAFLALFRASILVLMSFAIFHKLNADFFDASVSCATMHFQGVAKRLPLLETFAAAMPVLAILGELAIPVLLLATPRLGLAATLAIMTFVGHRGATTFTLLVMVHSIAFVEPGAGQWLRDGLRKRWSWLVGSIVLTSAASPLVYGRIDAQWFRYWTFELAIVVAAFGIAHVIFGAMSATAPPLRWRAIFERPKINPLLGQAAVVRTVTITLLLVGVLNGLTPYLGIKHRFSQAMFSNLRADQSRWNHFLVPESILIRDPLPYVRITGAEARHALSGEAAHRSFEDALYTPDFLQSRIEWANKSRLRLAFRAEYDGEVHHTRNAAFDRELLAWLATLDQGRLFYQSLTIDGPQACIH